MKKLCDHCGAEIPIGEGFTLDPSLVVTELDFTAFPRKVHAQIKETKRRLFYCDKCMEDE